MHGKCRVQVGVPPVMPVSLTSAGITSARPTIPRAPSRGARLIEPGVQTPGDLVSVPMRRQPIPRLSSAKTLKA